MPCKIESSDPSPEWLEDQTRGIERLDKSLRRSGTLLARLSSRLDQLRPRPKGAQLCKAHHGLDPKLIRRHTLHLIAECTERNDRLRDYQRRSEFPGSVKEWLRRMDAVIGMWMGARAFRAVFGYDQAASSKAVKDGCEACIMSVIGGRVQVLVDLRASLLSRAGSYGRRSRKEPRLSCLIESWIDHFGRDPAADIRRQSEKLAEAILAVRIQARPAKKEPEDDGASRTPSRRPVSRAESMTKKAEPGTNAKKPTRPRQGPVWAQNTDGRLDYAYFHNPPSTWGTSHEESDEEDPESASVQDAQSSDTDDPVTPGERAGLETSNWIDTRMKGKGLSLDDRLKLFEDDTHPALSDYALASATHSHRGRPRSMHSGSESGRRPQPDTNRPASAAGPPTSVAGRSIWESVSVASSSQYGSRVPSNPESAVASPSTVSTVTSLAPNSNARHNAPSLVSLPPDHEPYLAFCKQMGLEVNPERLKQQQASAPSRSGQPNEEGGNSPPPPSSIYSQD